MNSQYGQLPVGLIAQLVEHCTFIAEVMAKSLDLKKEIRLKINNFILDNLL